jgi:hypothetical protein
MWLPPYPSTCPCALASTDEDPREHFAFGPLIAVLTLELRPAATRLCSYVCCRCLSAIYRLISLGTPTLSTAFHPATLSYSRPSLSALLPHTPYLHCFHLLVSLSHSLSARAIQSPFQLLLFYHHQLVQYMFSSPTVAFDPKSHHPPNTHVAFWIFLWGGQ